MEKGAFGVGWRGKDKVQLRMRLHESPLGMEATAVTPDYIR